MASAFQAPFKGRLLASAAYRAAYVGPTAPVALNDRVFPFQKVYVGPSLRTARYKGTKTDSQIYLGNKHLFV